MRVSRVLVVLAVLMAVTTASQAQVRALGPGVGVSCNVWLEARTDPEGPLVFGLLSWVLGYITGAAVYGSVGECSETPTWTASQPRWTITAVRTLPNTSSRAPGSSSASR